MRFLRLFVAIAALSGCAASTVALERPTAPTPATSTQCPSRDTATRVSWHAAEPTDAVELARWCRAVGAPLFVNAHLEPLSSPRTLWIFKNPRGRQVRAILDLLEAPRFTAGSVAGVVLGGDFNTVMGGDREEAYRAAKAWSKSLRNEDKRRTHMMGRIDYLFFRLQDGWLASANRLDRQFGSDHHPILGRINAATR